MSNNNWMPLNEYSSKYKISMSTLRRRIRNSEIEHRFSGGKYWIIDAPIGRHNVKKHTKDQQAIKQTEPLEENRADDLVISNPSNRDGLANIENQNIENHKASVGLLDSANKLMQELKGAYVTVLHEKEEQILQLKEEIVDLKTLVRILETDNERLKAKSSAAAPTDESIGDWLEDSF